MIPGIAMLELFLRVTLADGTAAEARTWTTGPCARTALRDWKRVAPALATCLLSHRVVTEPPHAPPREHRRAETSPPPPPAPADGPALQRRGPNGKFIARTAPPP